ncbi:MAG: metalloregulator ArsR/SmtB family transcription factor [Pseudomonadota bacterium]
MTDIESLDQVFSALGDATRRAIVERLLNGETPLSELAEPFEMSQTAVSRHVNVLKDAGIVIIEKRGRTRHCRLDPKTMVDAADWLETYRTFWTNQFEALGHHLKNRKSPQ